MLIVFVGGPKDGLLREVHNPGGVLWIQRVEYEHQISQAPQPDYIPYRRIERKADRSVYLYAGHSEGRCEKCGCFHLRIVDTTCSLCGGALAAL